MAINRHVLSQSMNKDEKKITDSSDSTPLSMVADGQTVYLDFIDAGQDLKNRLVTMGIIYNSPIAMISNHSKGQIIVAVKGTKILLGRGMSNKIFVKAKQD